MHILGTLSRASTTFGLAQCGQDAKSTGLKSYATSRLLLVNIKKSRVANIMGTLNVKPSAKSWFSYVAVL